MKNKKKFALALALSFAILGNRPSFAATRLDLGVNTGNVAFSEGTFNLSQDEANKSQALSEVRAIRSRLWDENILYTLDENSNSKGERLQDVAKANGYTSKEEYVNGLSWSNDLEKIAIQRAYEQTLTGLSHQRPDGGGLRSSVSANGVRPGAEILAASTQKESPQLAFNQWSFRKHSSRNNKSEYQLLLDAKGVSDSGNGHLHIILDPELKHIGFASLNRSDDWNYGVAMFAFEIANNNQAATNLVGPYNIYAGDIKNAPKPEEKPEKSNKISEESIEKLRKSVKNARQTIAGAELLMQTMPNFGEKYGYELASLIDNQKTIISKAEALLKANGK